MKLWIENAHQSLVSADGEVCGDEVRTFQTEGLFFAVLASSPQGGVEADSRATRIADRASSMLAQGMAVDGVLEALLPALPDDGHIPFSILRVEEGCQAQVAECDAPPLFMTRGGRLVLLPVLEEVSYGHLVRTCQFSVEDGDHLAMVSERYICARGWSRHWGWRDIAVSVRRWTETGCDAERLLGALIRMYRRLAEGQAEREVTVVAMHVRPMRTATVWTGPPADPAQDEAALEKLMAERGTRVICGDTTAAIAAQLLGTGLELEPRPEDGWREVPPVSRLEGVDLVTEGLVTLGKARECMTGVKQVHDLPHGEDGATRLARVLLAADKIHFIVGLAVNPAQAADAAHSIPLRRAVLEDLVQYIRALGRLVSVEYL